MELYGPWVDSVEAEHEFGLKPVEEPEQGVYDAIVLAVAHEQFRELGAEGVRAFGQEGGCVLCDVEHVRPVSEVDGRLQVSQLSFR